MYGKTGLGVARYLNQVCTVVHLVLSLGLLICALSSENQGLQKLRSISNLRKFSGPAHLDFFSVCHLDFFQVYGINLAFFLGGKLEKNPGLHDLKFF